MSFTTAIKTCLSKYIVFSGRAMRPEYWWFVLFVVIASLVFGLIDWALFGVDPMTGNSRQVISGLFQLAVLLPMLAVGWRRMHDTGRPGWYLLLPVVVSFATMAFMMMGVFSFAKMENMGVNPNMLRSTAAMFGMTAMVAIGIVQFLIAVLLIWWLTRPSDPEPNEYGPPSGAL